MLILPFDDYSPTRIDKIRPKYATPIWHPHVKTQIDQVEKVQRTAARWTCRRWRNQSHVGDMLNELEWPSLEERREQSSLIFFHKIHSGTVSLDKDKYLTRQQDQCKLGHHITVSIVGIRPIVMPFRTLFSLELFQSGIVFLPLW